MELLAGHKISSYVSLVHDGRDEPTAQEVQGDEVLHGDFPSMLFISRFFLLCDQWSWETRVLDECTFTSKHLSEFIFNYLVYQSPIHTNRISTEYILLDMNTAEETISHRMCQHVV